MAEPSTKDRILDTFVYAPLGFALYARDAAPSFLRIFVARGRSEFDRHKDQVADQVNDSVENAMTVGQQAMASAPEVRKRVEGAAGQAIDLVEGVVTNLRESASQTVSNGGSTTKTPPPAPAPAPRRPSRFEAPRPSSPATESAAQESAPVAPTPSTTPTAPSAPAAAAASEPAPASAPSPAPAPRAETAPPSPSPAPAERPAASAGGALPIPDYDELAASQVVERLEGLDLTELEAVADYERARRGRRTILGKIEQLTG